jgi:hypothetical protein
LKVSEKVGTAKKHCQTAHFQSCLQHQEFLLVVFGNRESLAEELLLVVRGLHRLVLLVHANHGHLVSQAEM